MSIDILQSKIIEKACPVVAGIDPRPEHIPHHIWVEAREKFGDTVEAAEYAYLTFGRGIIDAVCDIVPAIKPQSAYYENLGWRGVRALEATIAYAREKGLYVIADVKRGDIGTTAAAYSEAYLGSVNLFGNDFFPFGCDCCTVNGYLGSDGVNPFLDTCRENDRAIFLLVKTSNPSSGELQDLKIGDRTLYETVGDLAVELSEDDIGKYGYAKTLGAVVGATYPAELGILRKRLKTIFFLIPGYGAQGGGAADVAPGFDENGRGAIVNASRSIMCAWKKTDNDGLDYIEAARNAAIEMKNAIGELVTVR